MEALNISPELEGVVEEILEASDERTERLFGLIDPDDSDQLKKAAERQPVHDIALTLIKKIMEKNLKMELCEKWCDDIFLSFLGRVGVTIPRTSVDTDRKIREQSSSTSDVLRSTSAPFTNRADIEAIGNVPVSTYSDNKTYSNIQPHQTSKRSADSTMVVNQSDYIRLNEVLQKLENLEMWHLKERKEMEELKKRVLETEKKERKEMEELKKRVLETEKKESKEMEELKKRVLETEKKLKEQEKIISKFTGVPDLIREARSKVVFIHYTMKSGKPFRGSGFSVDSGNYILTNVHVVENTDLVNITLSSERIVKGEVTDHDETLDLAFIKLCNEITIPAFKFEDLRQVNVCDPVVALGSPHGLKNSIMPGVISNLDRTAKEVRLYNKHIRYVQTTAILHHGSSGGPLVSLATGNVIAVNTYRHDIGISIGIPSTVAEKFVENANKTATQYTIGVSMKTVNGKPKKVVVLVDVWEDYPAHRAGLCREDMVVAINGQSVSSAHDVYKAVRNSCGSQLTINIYSQSRSEEKTIQLTPIHHPSKHTMPSPIRYNL